MSSEESKAVYQRYLSILSTGNFQAIPDVVDVEHFREECVNFTPGWVNFTEAQQNTTLFVGIPDLQLDRHDIYVDNDTVIARGSASGTHTGPLFGVPATGKAVSFQVVEIVRIANEKITERWVLQDTFTLAQQIGLITV